MMQENEELGEALHLQSLDALAVKEGVRLENTKYVSIIDGIAVVDLIGAIYPRANMMTSSGATSISQFAKDFLMAFNEPTVRGIVLNVDSPGGDVRGIGEAAEIVHRASKSGKKPIDTYAAGYLASAAYYVGSAAQRIIGNRSSLSGSIGVVLTARAKEDGEIEIVSNISPNKRPDPTSDEGLKVLQEQVDDLGAIFKSDVKKFRAISEEKFTQDYGQGAVKVGPRAKALGMIDDIGSLSGVVESMAREVSKHTGTYKRGPQKAEVATAGGNVSASANELLQFASLEDDNNMGLADLVNKFKASNKTVVEGQQAQDTTTAKESATGAPAVVVEGAKDKDAVIGTDRGGEGFTQAQLDAAKLTPIVKDAVPTRADLEEKFSDSAELFATNMTTDSRIWPAQQAHAASDLLNAKADDVLFGGTVKFVDENGELTEGTREAAVRARYLAMPKHSLAQKSIAGIKDGSIVASVLAEGDKESVKTSEIMTEERRQQLLGYSAQGQAVLANEAAKK